MKELKLIIFAVTSYLFLFSFLSCSSQQGCEETKCFESCKKLGFPNGGFCFEDLCHCYSSLPVDNDASTNADSDSDTDTDADSDTDTDADSDTDTDADSDTDTDADSDTDTDADTNPNIDYGDLCKYCQDHSQCGGSNDYCLINRQTGEVFCSKDCSNTPCPQGFTCFPISTPQGTIQQCVPEDGTCSDFPIPCDPPCNEGEECRQGRCIAPGEWEEELQHCVDVINSYRNMDGVPPLTRDPAIEAYAMEGARYDAENYTTCGPHCHFRTTNGGGVAIAENEIPGWPLGAYGSVNVVIEQGTQMMYGEGPGGGHHDNLVNPNFTRVGCGIYVTPDNRVWVVQDFR